MLILNFFQKKTKVCDTPILYRTLSIDFFILARNLARFAFSLFHTLHDHPFSASAVAGTLPLYILNFLLFTYLQ